jgi:hypothetical protein
MAAQAKKRTRRISCFYLHRTMEAVREERA